MKCIIRCHIVALAEWTIGFSTQVNFLLKGKGATTSLSGGRGPEDFFSADNFFQLMLKLDFFSERIEGQIFLLIVF